MLSKVCAELSVGDIFVDELQGFFEALLVFDRRAKYRILRFECLCFLVQRRVGVFNLRHGMAINIIESRECGGNHCILVRRVFL